jgi:hypothetical protein
MYCKYIHLLFQVLKGETEVLELLAPSAKGKEKKFIYTENELELIQTELSKKGN